MDFGDFWRKMKLRVCLFCFCCFQHIFVGAKATRTASEVKSCVFSLPSFQRCRQTWMCVYGTFLHEMNRNNTQCRNVQKRIVNTTVGAYTHQISSQSEHYKKGHAEKNISPSEPRNQITYLRVANILILLEIVRGELESIASLVWGTTCTARRVHIIRLSPVAL